MAFLLQFNKEPERYGFTYGDSLQFVLLNNKDNYSVKSICNDKPLDLTSSSVSGVLPLEDWINLMIDNMYYGSLEELQSTPWAERPESHITRDSQSWETNFQWYFKQKKYEDRWFRKNVDDKSTIALETYDLSDS